jgi:glycosyltransferase involved in cell wall biosynthesis
VNTVEASASVVYVVMDKMGGIFSLNSNLMRYRPQDAMRQEAILISASAQRDAASRQTLGADREIHVGFDRDDNRYSVLARIRDAIPVGPGPLVSNDWPELAVCQLYDTGRTLVQIVHDEYNLRLATQYQSVVDVFIAHSEYFHQKLLRALPHSSGRIFHLPYGVPVPNRARARNDGPLRLVFVGRITQAKGVYDLPVIDDLLRELDVPVTWTVIGDGPEREALQTRWTRAHVAYCSPDTNAEVLERCADGDVLVFPTRFEGFPVALLEGMSAGLVPVVSDLPSGIPEVVSASTGFRVPVGEQRAFAAAIHTLHSNREMLERMSAASRQTVIQRFDIADRAAAYHRLFGRWEELRRPRLRSYPTMKFNRLDKPWLPNWLVRELRRIIRHIKGEQ